MSQLDKIQAPIAAEMAEFEVKFRQFMKSKVMLLDVVMSYIVKRKGKQMRPMLVFLSAGMCGNIGEKTHRGAALIELLHTATLIHDDVVDEANYRRGFFSVNALWKNKVAVLAGDYLLSRGLLLSVDNQDFDLLQLVSKAVREMSEGELLQIEKTRLLNITEEIYYEVIRQKTATLISACCAVGAASVSASPEIVQTMAVFGEKIGMAFQIKDDLFDYGDDEIGKPVGIDIKEKKMTLPLIYTLRNADGHMRKHLIGIVKNHSDNPQKVREVIDIVKKSGGIEYTQNEMNRFIAEAMLLLEKLPASAHKDAMRAMVQYVIERKK